MCKNAQYLQFADNTDVAYVMASVVPMPAAPPISRHHHMSAEVRIRFPSD
jgi:hypothetical protein